MRTGKMFFWLSLIGLIGRCPAATPDTYVYHTATESYRYSVSPTGENYTFKFERSPDSQAEKLAAGYQVMRQIYRDDSIEPHYRSHYIRERARCYLYDSRFYSYTLCFLPNDFNRAETARFWGFVTQMPNWTWLATHILLPAALAFGGIFYFSSRTSAAD